MELKEWEKEAAELPGLLTRWIHAKPNAQFLDRELMHLDTPTSFIKNLQSTRPTSSNILSHQDLWYSQAIADKTPFMKQPKPAS